MLIKAQLMITPRHNVFFIGHLFAILTDSHFCGRDLSTNDCFTVGQPKTISDFSSIACFRIRLSKNVQFCVLQPNIITNFRLLPLVYLVSALISLTAARSARICILPIQFQNPNRKKLSRKYCIRPGTSGTGRPGNFKNPRLLEFSCTGLA